MNFELKLAWKYFRSRRKSLARFTAIAAIVGITCGVAGLIIAQALSRGFSSEMQEKILANTAHITIFQTNSREISDWLLIKQRIEKIENVRDVSPTTYDSAVVISEKTASYAILRAVAEKNDDSEIGISVGAELAEKTGLKAGDEAEIVIPQKDSAPKNIRARVQRIFRTGIYDYDSTWIYISPEDLARSLEKERFNPTVLSVSVEDIYKADTAAREIRRILPADFKVIDWQEANQPLFAALSLERKVSLAIISLIIFIAALNITTTLVLLINERKLDIAVLRTCGAQTRSLIFIFLSEGLILGFIGIIFGAVLGLSVCFAGNYYKIINLPSEIYSLSYVPLLPDLKDVLLTITATLFLTLSAAIYPAWRAARVKPLENLRNQ